MTMLKSTIGIVGDNVDDEIKHLKNIYDKFEIEKNRHALLIKSQTSLQLMYVINHFDNDQNSILDEIELTYAKQYILNILPNLRWDVVISQIKNREQ